MARRRRYLLAGALCLFALPGYAAAGAVAAGGAERIVTNECWTETDARICFAVKAVYNVTETPSGKYIVNYNSRYKYSLVAPNCSNTRTGREHQSYVLQAGVTSRAVFSETLRVDLRCGGTNQTCTLKSTTVLAGGKVRQNRVEGDCL